MWYAPQSAPFRMRPCPWRDCRGGHASDETRVDHGVGHPEAEVAVPCLKTSCAVELARGTSGLEHRLTPAGRHASGQVLRIGGGVPGSEQLGKLHRIEHRGIGALALKRTHRMRRVTDQPHVAIAYLLGWVAVVV